MNYPAGLFIRVLYSLSLLGLVVAGALMGFSWAGLVLGGPPFGRLGLLVFLCFALFRIVQIFRNPRALNVYAPNPALRFFRGAALFLMIANFLLIGVAVFMKPITNWLFNGQTGDAGITYFIVTLGLLLGLLLTSSGLVLYEAVRLIGNAYKRNADDEDHVVEHKVKRGFGVKYKAVLIVLVLVAVSSYFIPHRVWKTSPFSSILGASPPPHFEEICRQTGINILSAPQQEVRSVYLAHGPGSSDGRFKYPIHDKNRIGPTYWGSEFFPELAVDSPYADVIVTYDADDKQVADGPFVNRKLARYTVTATDRRNSQVLGKMSYAIDISKGFACGANTPEGIDVNAFLRQVTAMSGGQVIPSESAPKAVAQLVDSQIFSPPRVSSFEQLEDERQVDSMSKRCDSMLPKIGGARRRFADTTSGLRFMRSELSDQLICLEAAIFQVRNIGEMNHQPIQVDKYTPDGRHLYSLQVSTSNSSEPTGFVVEKDFGAADGFLHFEKWKAAQNGGSWILEKISKFRVAEPKALEDANSIVSKEVPEWATFFHEENIEVEKEFPSDVNSLVIENEMRERAKDTSRRATCGQMAPEDPRQFGTRRFAADAAGIAGMVKLGIADLCDDLGIWSIGERMDQRGQAFIVQKYTSAGLPQYKVKFRAKAENDNQTWVYLIEPSLRSQDGYLHFELWFCRPATPQDGNGFVGDKYVVLRHIAARVKEPPL